MSKILLVAGCSHSCGSEIMSIGSHREDPKNVEKCFGNKIALRNNMQMVNIAFAGASNGLIVDTIIKNINRLTATGILPEDIIVLIGWSGLPRDYAIQNNIYWGWTLNQHNMSNWKSYATKDVRKYYKLWTRFQDHDVLCNAHVARHQLLSGYLCNKGVKYYAFNAVDGLAYPRDDNDVSDVTNFFNENKSDLTGFKEVENDPYYRLPFDHKNSYFHSLQLQYNLDPRAGGRWFHYLENGHEIWADVLEKEMKELGLL